MKRRVTCPTCGRELSAIGYARHRKVHADPTSLLLPSRDEQRAIVDLYARGMSMREVGRELFYGQATIWRVLHAQGAYVRPRGGVHRDQLLSADAMLETAQLYGRGLSIREIADVLDLSMSTVHERLSRAGVKRRSRGGYHRRTQTRPTGVGAS